ncbi:MAG: DUF402 domain-containing protein [Chloroflexota bacterium]|nr:DUF402 domain-containing protein [Chloroflexota bacterium]
MKLNVQVTVIKQDARGRETWRYDGEVLRRSQGQITIEAYFGREVCDLHGLRMRRGDRFVETYFFDRWYNIFEIHDRGDDGLKGWYCNVASPAVFEKGVISYRDLALDVLVFPDGRQLVLDEDEFAALSICPDEREEAITALAELQGIFRQRCECWGAGAGCDVRGAMCGVRCAEGYLRAKVFGGLRYHC